MCILFYRVNLGFWETGKVWFDVSGCVSYSNIKCEIINQSISVCDSFNSHIDIVFRSSSIIEFLEFMAFGFGVSPKDFQRLHLVDPSETFLWMLLRLRGLKTEMFQTWMCWRETDPTLLDSQRGEHLWGRLQQNWSCCWIECGKILCSHQHIVKAKLST